MQFLAKGSILEKLPTYNYLTKLYLSMVNFKDLRHNLMICCFFRSSPVLRDLEIEVRTRNQCMLNYLNASIFQVFSLFFFHFAG